MKSFIFTAVTSKAKNLVPELSKANRGVIITKLSEDQLKFTFKKSLISKFITVDSFYIQFKKYGLSPYDYQIQECLI